MSATVIASLMIGLASFAACFYCGRRAPWAGFLAMMVVGYFYGILRANLDNSYAHFLYDFASGGYYLALLISHKNPVQHYKLRRIMPWVAALAAWPLLLLLVPTQAFLVQLVGLRGQVFFLPFLAAGAMMESDDVRKITYGAAVLNFIALAFALLEVQFGVPRFFPFNAVDQIIYRSTDVFIGGLATFRIPSIFENSAAYGGTMAVSMPLLIGAVVQERPGLRRKMLYGAIAATGVGVFLSASRTSVLFLVAIFIGILTAGRVRRMPRVGWIALGVFLVLIAGTSSRMQRFLSLEDTRYVKFRIHSSVNDNFFQAVADYPMGNGLGGGGTSMPYFLASQVRHPVGMENEYGRIMLEVGLPGLALWLALITWTLTRPLPRKNEIWYVGRWLARVALAFGFLSALVGTGLLTSIPETSMTMFYIGWITAPNVVHVKKRVEKRAGPSGQELHPDLGTIENASGTGQ
jgi:hypothetical protein